MSSKNLFSKPFDDGTIDKLKIFKDYFKEWLPVFIAKENPIWKEIQIFDFFAGQGQDANGVYGSPMIIVSVLNENKELILKSKVKINIILNEVESYFDSMKDRVEAIADKSIYSLKYYNEDFIKVFAEYYSSMRNTANFLFLDQNGIKQITEEIFKKIIELKQTDFIFFISSSYITRFGDLESFQKYLKITKQDLAGKSYYHIHRIVLEYYRSRIPNNRIYFLAPFSIKKPSGIYGLIFGTNHTYGLEKFLKVCWKHDKLTGEANFDIDNEKIDLNKPSLFKELDIPTKRQIFERDLKKQIMDKSLKTDRDVYMFTLSEGFLMKDANTILESLRKDLKIDFDFNTVNSKLHKITGGNQIKTR
jgi:three-Cys-motif partner protein